MNEILASFFAKGHMSLEVCAHRAIEAFTQLVRGSHPELGEDALLESTLHLRSHDSYQVLISRKQEQGPEMGRTEVGSASLWRWVREAGASIGLDVGLRCLHMPGTQTELSIEEETFQTSISLQIMLTRDATHILAVPLYSARGDIVGMFTLELLAAHAIGRAAFWSDWMTALDLLSHIITPHLLEAAEAPREEEQTHARPDPLLPVVGTAMRARVELARRFAAQPETLLLQGPSGAGKSRLARWCHAHSAHPDAPFEVLDLLTVPEEMQMAELVGWRRGAFTGATQDMDGAIARAEGGTLFLDEIDKLSLKTQAGLLRLLEEGVYRRLGDRGSARHARTRFIVGTNQNLEAAVERGTFREDLYWRINVLPIALLGLDERREEIPDWIHFMTRRYSAERGLQVSWSLEALGLMKRRSWPGNLRELDNVVRRACILATTDARDTARVEPRHVISPGATSSPLLEHMKRAARAFVELAPERGLTLDHAGAFRGLVLEEAAGPEVDAAAAFERLGLEQLVAHRNHHRHWNREAQRLASLREVLS